MDINEKIKNAIIIKNVHLSSIRNIVNEDKLNVKFEEILDYAITNKIKDNIIKYFIRIIKHEKIDFVYYAVDVNSSPSIIYIASHLNLLDITLSKLLQATFIKDNVEAYIICHEIYDSQHYRTYMYNMLNDIIAYNAINIYKEYIKKYLKLFSIRSIVLNCIIKNNIHILKYMDKYICPERDIYSIQDIIDRALLTNNESLTLYILKKYFMEREIKLYHTIYANENIKTLKLFNMYKNLHNAKKQ